MTSLTSALATTLIPVAAMALAGAMAAVRAPGPRLRSAMLHLAGGVVFAVVAVELLPELVHERAPISTAVGFAIGTIAMLALRSFTARFEDSGEEESSGNPGAAAGLPFGLLAATGIDILIDGFVLGIGFAAGARVGLLLTLALVFELISLGFAVGATLRTRGLGIPRTIGVTAGLGSLVLVGVAAALAPLRNLSADALAGVLAFGVAALLFLVTEELLKEAHEEKETPLLTAMFFAGFLAILLFAMSGA